MILRNIFFTISFLFLSNLLLSQEVPEAQKSLIVKRTADWCTNCGTWGWTFFENLKIDNQNNAILFSAHNSGNLQNPTAVAIVNNLGGFSQPRYYHNNMDMGVASFNVDSKRTEFKDQVIQYTNQPLVVSAGLNAILSGDTLEVNTKTKFFQATTGDYYVTVYLVEDEVLHQQSGHSGEVAHPNILRSELANQAFGISLMGGEAAFEKDMEFDHSFATILDPEWKLENLEVVVMVWKKMGAGFEYINAHATSQFDEPSSTNNPLAKVVNFSIYPTLLETESTIELNILKSIPQAEWQISTPQGQVIHQQMLGQLATGQHQFPISKAAFPNSGWYVVSFSNGKHFISKRILVP